MPTNRSTARQGLDLIVFFVGLFILAAVGFAHVRNELLFLFKGVGREGMTPEQAAWRLAYDTLINLLLLGLMFGWLRIFQKMYPVPKQNIVAASSLSCPKCNELTPRGSRPVYQLICSICLFPFGLLTLLAGRNPTVCRSCGFRWQV